MKDYITGEKFIGIADMVYAPVDSRDCNPLINTFNISLLKDVNIVYTHTLYVKRLFKEISGLGCEFIIISHNCDENVDASYIVPSNVKVWFTQNVNIRNKKIKSIPIGLENSKWFRDLHKKEKMIAKLQEPRKYKNAVYMNHNIKTNPAERQPVYNLLKDKSWVTVDNGINGKGFDEYIDNIYNHKFVICPMGNGMDTHRLWETLYLGSIPIVKEDNNNHFYSDLPLCYVDEWTEVTEQMTEELFRYYKGSTWMYEMLEFNYWREKILSYVGN